MKNKLIISIILIGLVLSGITFYVINTNKTNENTNKEETNTSTSDDSDWSNYETYEVTLNGNLEITKDGVYKLTGSITDGQITINTSGNVKLILNNVSITNTTGPAINVIDAKNVYIELVGENTITSTTTEDLDGAIYSKSDLFLEGDGTLNVTSNYDGIVSKDDLTIYSGIYVINSDDDGIRGKDSVTINNGNFTIKSTGTAIKSTNDQEKGNVTINGGTFIITSKKDGIHANGLLEINNGTFDITAVEGLEATYVKINDGTINISASDDGINATNKSTEYSVTIEINGGNITIKMGQGDTDGLDSNGNIYINGGTLNITGNSPFDYDGEAKYTGGKMIINGEETTTITNQFAGQMGGPGGQAPNQGGNPNQENTQGGPNQERRF